MYLGCLDFFEHAIDGHHCAGRDEKTKYTDLWFWTDRKSVSTYESIPEFAPRSARARGSVPTNVWLVETWTL